MNNIHKVVVSLLFIAVSPLFSEKSYVKDIDLSGYEKQELQDAYNTLGLTAHASSADLEKALKKNTSSFAITQSAKSKNAFVKAAYELIKKRRAEEAGRKTQATKDTSGTENDYTILGIKSTATDGEIRTAFRKLSLKNHPDKGGDAEEFKKISAAYDRIALSRNFK